MNEDIKIRFIEHILIRDPETGEVFLNKRDQTEVLNSNKKEKNKND